MTILLEIEDSKMPFLMELLQNFTFVKTQPNTIEKTSLLQKTKKPTNTVNFSKKNVQKDPFAEVRGIWADRDIDGAMLRKQAWGIEE